MQNLNKVWQAVNAAASARDLAQNAKTYSFAVTRAVTFYLQTENAEIRIGRWERPQIEVNLRLQGAFGWRVAAEQDEAGVYIAAKRRVVVGKLSSAEFDVMLPLDTYLTLKLKHCALSLDHLNGIFHIPPGGQEVVMEVEEEGSV